MIYRWAGFFQPIDNLPTQNSVKAGSAVPVKFSLGGYQGMSVLAAGYPTSNVAACDAAAGDDPVETTLTAGNSGLSYDAASRPVRLRLEDRQGVGGNVPPAAGEAGGRHRARGELQVEVAGLETHIRGERRRRSPHSFRN